MQKFIILFRAINVGGKNLLPMKELVPLLKTHDFDNVSSYIQSGNIVLTSAVDPTEQIKHIVNDNYGFSPDVFVMTEAAFLSAQNNNPFSDIEGKLMHFYFCKNNINLVQEKIDKYLADSEQYIVKDNVFYLHAPSGIGRSKLVANIEACIDQKATGRNLNTINKLSAMLTMTH